MSASAINDREVLLHRAPVGDVHLPPQAAAAAGQLDRRRHGGRRASAPAAARPTPPPPAGRAGGCRLDGSEPHLGGDVARPRPTRRAAAARRGRRTTRAGRPTPSIRSSSMRRARARRRPTAARATRATRVASSRGMRPSGRGLERRRRTPARPRRSRRPLTTSGGIHRTHVPYVPAFIRIRWPSRRQCSMIAGTRAGSSNTVPTISPSPRTWRSVGMLRCSSRRPSDSCSPRARDVVEEARLAHHLDRRQRRRASDRVAAVRAAVAALRPLVVELAAGAERGEREARRRCPSPCR